jgi:hypothetical protein
VGGLTSRPRTVPAGKGRGRMRRVKRTVRRGITGAYDAMSGSSGVAGARGAYWATGVAGAYDAMSGSSGVGASSAYSVDPFGMGRSGGMAYMRGSTGKRGALAGLGAPSYAQRVFGDGVQFDVQQVNPGHYKATVTTGVPRGVRGRRGVRGLGQPRGGCVSDADCPGDTCFCVNGQCTTDDPLGCMPEYTARPSILPSGRKARLGRSDRRRPALRPSPSDPRLVDPCIARCTGGDISLIGPCHRKCYPARARNRGDASRALHKVKARRAAADVRALVSLTDQGRIPAKLPPGIDVGWDPGSQRMMVCCRRTGECCVVGGGDCRGILRRCLKGWLKPKG